ncbi:MAG TPA: hypothetical protein VG966_05745 [Hyphomicrobiaceae bacterium]|jgi:hypothetical protein|nr:hypothetical protein [Hyphomicrobiaceae bacterium]
MPSFRPSTFLRHALLADAVASGATALLLIIGAGVLDGLLGLPVALMRGAGLILIPYVAFVAWLGTRERLTGSAVRAVIILNAIWAAASLLVLVGGAVAPTMLGYAFVVLQALVVALFGELQHVGLRRPAMEPA